MELRDKTALVFGGSSGIGRAIAERFAAEGAIVGVVGSGMEKAESVARAISDSGGSAWAFSADVTDPTAVNVVVSAFVENHSCIDILVNSAGVYYPTILGETFAEDCKRMVAINLLGMHFAVDAASAHMKARHTGKIVNLSSVAAYVGSKDYGLYSATKAAVVALTKSFALQLAPYGINVNAIAPGNTETPMNEAIRTLPEYADRRAMIEATTPSTRTFSKPEDMAEAALFLASHRGQAMHGATMLLDEGRAAGM